MTVNAADPKFLPTTDPASPKHIAKPNAFPLPADQWTKVEIGLPSVVLITTASAATINAIPDKVAGDPVTQGEVYAALKLSDTSYLFYFHAPGNWRIRTNVAASSARIIDTYDGILPILMLLRAVGIAGTAGVADVVSGVNDAQASWPRLGLLTNNRNYAWGSALNDWIRVWGDAPSTVSGITWSAMNAFYANAIMAARVGTGTTLDVLSASAYSTSPTFAGRMMLNIMAVPYFQHMVSAGNSPASGVRDVVTDTGNVFPLSVPARESGYLGALKSRRYVITPKPNLSFKATSAFALTDPSVLLVPPATDEWILRRVILHPIDTVTAATIHVALCIDPDNRYSSGGTSFIPTNGFRDTNRGAAAAGLTPTQARYYDGATAIVASAADNDEMYYGERCFTDDEAPVIFDLDDEGIAGPAGSVLLYVWGDSSFDYVPEFRFENANIQ